jgi:hypothetical protein
MFSADERNERWLKVSIGLLRFEEHMMPLVQQLGRLDARLIQADETWPDQFFQKAPSYEDGSTLHEHITLSYLWVLGAYEFVRTLCDRIKMFAHGSAVIPAHAPLPYWWPASAFLPTVR